MLKAINQAGIRSDYMFAAGFASIALSYITHFASRAKDTDTKAQADRWGLFIGEWAPTFFALGTGLKMEEVLSQR